MQGCILSNMKSEICVFLSLLFMVFIGCDTGSSKVETKPNIVFILADDMTYNAIRALGNDEIHTPNLDRLVRSGTTFTHAYNMGGWNGAVCIASRSMLASGYSIWRAEQFVNEYDRGDSSLVLKTWAKRMEDVGYRTYMTGKWHVTIPAGRSFMRAEHIRPGMPRDAGFFGPIRKWIASEKQLDWASLMPPGYNRPLNPEDDSWSPVDTSWGGFWEGGTHWSEVVRDDALEFLADAGQHDSPFFMYLAFNAPHDPRQAPDEYLKKYPLDQISVPDNFLPLYEDQDGIGLGKTLRDEALAPFPRTEYAVRVHLQEYYAIISHLDAQVGLMLDALEKSGKWENTYVFFSADHGLGVGQHGLLGKQNMYDHSMRVPFIVMGPGVASDQKIEHDIYLQDIVPTSLDLAGVKPLGELDFRSLKAHLHGERDDPLYPAVYGAYMDYQRMIRKNGRKLIVYPKLNKLKYFDLDEDPMEISDLSANPSYKSEITELYRELVDLQLDMQDTLKLSNWISL